MRSRDPRDDRDIRDREPNRPRASMSHEPSSSKDVSPPPVAPSAPAFGSVPNRTPSVAEVSTPTGKAPPAGPRALTEAERPLSAGHGGPLRPAMGEPGGPVPPSGPRSQQIKTQRPSSKQWINPNLQAAKKMADAPKIHRSQSFVSSQRPFQRAESLQAEQQAPPPSDLDRRPRTSDSKADTHVSAADDRLKALHLSEQGDGRQPEASDDARRAEGRGTEGKIEAQDEKKEKAMAIAKAPPLNASSIDSNYQYMLHVPGIQVTNRPRGPQVVVKREATPLATTHEDSFESDDEDFDDDWRHDIELGISKAEEELAKLERERKPVPIAVAARYASLIHEGLLRVVNEDDTLKTLLGEVPPELLQQAEAAAAADGKGDERLAAVQVADATSVDGDKSSSELLAPKGGRTPLPASRGVRQSVEDQMEIDETFASKESKVTKDVSDVVMTEAPAVGSGVVTTNGLAADGADAAVRGDAKAEADADAEATGDDQMAATADGPAAKAEETSPSPMEEDVESEIEVDEATLESVRERIATPPVDELPDYALPKVNFMEEVDDSNGFHEFILNTMREEYNQKDAQRSEIFERYRADYRTYLQFTMSNDPAAVKNREKNSTGSGGSDSGGTGQTPGPDSKPEGGRTAGRRFASERDLERILLASKAEEEERKEREARIQKEKYRSDKEAVIPDMYWTEEEWKRNVYYDKSGFVPVEKLVAVYQALPAVSNFTEEEAELFEKAYLEQPKQWGEIAKHIPGRDFKACILYYYLHKKDLNLKEKLKRQPRKRRKKATGKTRSSALVSELGNGEEQTEENTETGESGERRRPRRAAAPTWPFEMQAADGENGAGNSTPGRGRGANSSRNANKDESGAEKTETKKGRRPRGANKEAAKKAAAAAAAAAAATASQTLAPATPSSSGKGGNRSRSNSRVQGSEQPPILPVAADGQQHAQRLPGQMQTPFSPGQPSSLAPPAPPPRSPSGEAAFSGAVSGPTTASAATATAPTAGISDVMAPPSLRPEPPSMATVATQQASTTATATPTTWDITTPATTRAQQQASSYWSVSETNDFPALLAAFGSDWAAMASYMQSKTAVMVS